MMPSPPLRRPPVPLQLGLGVLAGVCAAFLTIALLSLVLHLHGGRAMEDGWWSYALPLLPVAIPVGAFLALWIGARPGGLPGVLALGALADLLTCAGAFLAVVVMAWRTGAGEGLAWFFIIAWHFGVPLGLALGLLPWLATAWALRWVGVRPQRYAPGFGLAAALVLVAACAFHVQLDEAWREVWVGAESPGARTARPTPSGADAREDVAAQLEAQRAQAQVPVALALAIHEGDTETVQALLAAGADAGAPLPGGWLPLHMAADQGQPGVARILLAGGASADAADPSGRTALHLAAARGHVGVVEVLLAHGARPDPADRQGGTPLLLAEAGGHDGVVRLLRAAGGR